MSEENNHDQANLKTTEASIADIFTANAARLDCNYDRVYERMNDRLLLRLNHAIIGMAGEVGELTDSVKKSIIYGKPIDIENLKEECGDTLWYMAQMLDEIGSSFEEVMKMNIDKLAKRYPEGFTEQAAIRRADKG